MSSIGSLLKEARNKKAISLEEVHFRIKIHPRVLQLLEEDKFEKLPSPVFVKSFLRSYAQFLEMNPEEIVRAYEKEGVREPMQQLYIRSAAERERKNFFNFDKSLLIIPVIILVLFIAGGFLSFFLKTATHHLKGKRVVSIIKSSKAKSVKTEIKPVKAAMEASVSENDWLRHVSLGNFPKIGKKDTLTLKIKAADTVWLKITSDGKVLFQSILKRGITETWTAGDHFEIWTGNASDMNLILNNYDLGSPGKGVIKRMLINHEGIRIPS